MGDPAVRMAMLTKLPNVAAAKMSSFGMPIGSKMPSGPGPASIDSVAPMIAFSTKKRSNSVGPLICPPSMIP